MLRPLLLLLICYAPAAMAGVYKWVDEQGNVHYGDRPRSTDNAEALSVEAQSVDNDLDENRSEQRQRLLDAMQEDREELARQRKQQAEQKKRRLAQCKKLKKYYERHRHASGVYRKDKEGNRSYLSNEQRAAAESRYRKRLQELCR